MGVLVVRAATNDQRFFGLAQLDLKRGYDLAREFVLHGENIGEVTIEAVGPDMRTALCVDELAGNADAVARLAHPTSQPVTHAEFAADPLHVDRLALVGEARVAGDDVQLRQLRKIGDDVLADTV